jgi:hypothetical protein
VILQLERRTEVEVAPVDVHLPEAELAQRLRLQAARLGVGVVDADHEGEQLGAPLVVAGVVRLARRPYHRIAAAHAGDVAPRALHGRQRVERRGVALEPAQVAGVDVAHRVLHLSRTAVL